MRKSHFEIRRAKAKDATDVTTICNQGIDERLATFNTEYVTAEEIREKIAKGGDKHPVFVATLTNSNHVVGLGFDFTVQHSCLLRWDRRSLNLRSK